MPRKRKDFGEAPVDGDYSRDQVVNKRPGCRYVWALDEDIPEYRARGFKRVERAADAPTPRFDEFAEEGGTLVFLNRASAFAIEQFKLPVRDITAGLKRTELFTPGTSTQDIIRFVRDNIRATV